MAAWRRKSIESFPELSDSINRRGYTLQMLFFDLLPMMREAAKIEDRPLLAKIFSFTEWCLQQEAGNLHNAVAVSFYEHIFDKEWEKRQLIAYYISPSVAAQIMLLLDSRLTPEKLTEVRRLFRI